MVLLGLMAVVFARCASVAAYGGLRAGKLGWDEGAHLRFTGGEGGLFGFLGCSAILTVGKSSTGGKCSSRLSVTPGRVRW